MPKGSKFAETRQFLASNTLYARQLLRINQEELAERANLHRTQVSAMERQVSGASADSIGMLARAIGIPAYVLLMPPTLAHPIILQATQPKT
mgnify:CR=1 FL=1